MAAPMRNVVFRSLHKNFPFSVGLQKRTYARGYRNKLYDVLSPEEEQLKLTDRNIGKKDPRLEVNSYPFDPVKDNLPVIKKPMKKVKLNHSDKQQTLKESSNLEQKSQNDRKSKVKKDQSEKKGGNPQKSKVKKDQSENKEAKTRTFENMTYEILDDEDTKFGKVVMNSKSRNIREKKREILLEGSRLILDALKAGAKMKVLYFSGNETLGPLTRVEINAPVYKVTYRSMKIWSDTETPAGLLAIFEKPKEGEAMYPAVDRLPVTLICDQIRDPGNMGTLIRTAAAVGCERILAMKGCVDVWDPKVIRAGAGCHFRVPIINNLPWENIPGYIPEPSAVFAADINKPTQRRIDRLSNTSSEDVQQVLEMEEMEVDYLDDDAESDEIVDKSFTKKDILQKYEKAPLPVKMYHEASYSDTSNFLIIGGEARGISAEARKLTFNNCGSVVMIPMCDGINSLNTSIAGSIILYEMYKHIKNRQSKATEESPDE